MILGVFQYIEFIDLFIHLKIQIKLHNLTL
jgi:hypothetical protein